MEVSQPVSFSSENFEKSVTFSWQQLQSDVVFSDVTLVCDDSEVAAHKLVLSRCSPVLSKMLTRNTHPHPVIFLPRVKSSILGNLVTFMYQGFTSVKKEQLEEFMEAAKDLQINGLINHNDDKVKTPNGINSPKHIMEAVKDLQINVLSNGEKVKTAQNPNVANSPEAIMKENKSILETPKNMKKLQASFDEERVCPSPIFQSTFAQELRTNERTSQKQFKLAKHKSEQEEEFDNFLHNLDSSVALPKPSNGNLFNDNNESIRCGTKSNSAMNLPIQRTKHIGTDQEGNNCSCEECDYQLPAVPKRNHLLKSGLLSKKLYTSL